MTVHEFIEQLFSRPQANVASNMRYITPAQLELLERLIAADPQYGARRAGMHGGFVWTPAGRWKYVVSQYPDGSRRSLMRLNAERATGAGSLFD